MRDPHVFRIAAEEVPGLVERARAQEEIYGHNTGHFTLDVEKENTITGVLGEHAVAEYLTGCFQGVDGVQIGLTTFGAPVDIEVRVGDSLVGVHVKCGLWKRWPGDHFEFGVHADQGIQDGDNPLVLVTLRHPAEDGSRIGRIEGFLMPAALRECVLLGKGERFPSTGVISRTDNLVTTIGDYQPLDQLPSLLLKRLGCLS
mgnify:FL=1